MCLNLLQSVTAVSSIDDHNSYWQINGKFGSECTRGYLILYLNRHAFYNSIVIKFLYFREPIKCGQTVTLLHVSTGARLHSHHFHSPLSHNLEVSAFEGGDSG